MISTTRLKQLITAYYVVGEESMLKNHGADELYEIAVELRALANSFQKLGDMKAYPGRRTVSPPPDVGKVLRPIPPCVHCGALKMDHMQYQSDPNKLRCPIADRVSFYKAAQ